MTAAVAPPTGGPLALASAAVHGLAAGWLRETRELRHSPDSLMALVTAPLLTLVFLAIMLQADRHDLAPFAVLAPALLVLWQMALQTSGDVVESERDNGSLEALVAAPSPLPAVLCGRVLAVTTVSLLGFVESWLVALLFGVRIEFYHPVLLLLAVLTTAFATACSALALAALFVRTRAARAFQNTLTYPFYILGGVIVPITYLPEVLHPLTRLVFLSWSSDLMRHTLQPGPVPEVALHLFMIVGLGVVGAVAAALLIRAALREVRRTGEIGNA